MSKYSVLLTDRAWPSLDLERELLAKVDAELIEAPDDSEETLCELAKSADAIATCWAQVTARVIESAPKCKIVARLGIGLDNIDIEAATRRSIPVTNIPDYCVTEVAEHTMGLLLALVRKISHFDREIKQGRYDLPAAGPMNRLEGQTLGLVGFGRIAQAVRDRALGFGLNVIAHSNSGKDYGTGCEMVSLKELLSRSDVVSLHAPLTEKSHQLMNSETFSVLKEGAFLINTSRGGLIEEVALRNAIESGRLRGAGLDVFDPEPPDLDNPLLQHPNVIVTPHAAFTSEESLCDLRTRVCAQICEIFTGNRPEHVVNPKIY